MGYYSLPVGCHSYFLCCYSRYIWRRLIQNCLDYAFANRRNLENVLIIFADSRRSIPFRLIIFIFLIKKHISCFCSHCPPRTILCIQSGAGFIQNIYSESNEIRHAMTDQHLYQNSSVLFKSLSFPEWTRFTDLRHSFHFLYFQL